ncbi:MAG: phosphate regulon sensor histidine kinase PhoR [Gammaproteobacteria bacterium]|nr:phosphate regulon sensor histidine kinase PhoR [Gammaproteobacteria bacterium]MCW8983010.1 phosphate regulon sensor histidine kinase PhoR [Gammaproteobacteria bacterium]
METVIFIIIAGLFVGLIAGEIAWTLVITLLLLVGWNLFYQRKLLGWLQKGRNAPPPEARGMWGEIFHMLHRRQQSHHRRKKRLAQMVGRFQEMTSALPDAAVLLGENGTIVWFNQAAKQLLGLHRSTDSGQRIGNLLRHPLFLQQFNTEAGEAGFNIPSPIDENISLQVWHIPLAQNQSLLIARDVSQQQQLEQMRRDFVANVSHEMRTPLTVIRGFIETMIDSQDPDLEAWIDSVEMMAQQSGRMENLIDDLLLLSKVERRQEQRELQQVVVSSLIKEIVNGGQPLADEKGIQVELELDDELRLLGNERELYSAFNNLFTNAIRYTPADGKIQITWRQNDNCGATLSVVDSGIGIPPQHLNRITERFYRVDVGRSRDMGGTGLGLAIVKHVLNRHNAQLKVESRLNVGSRFSCQFDPDQVINAEKRVAV